MMRRGMKLGTSGLKIHFTSTRNQSLAGNLNVRAVQMQRRISLEHKHTKWCSKNSSTLRVTTCARQCFTALCSYHSSAESCSLWPWLSHCNRSAGRKIAWWWWCRARQTMEVLRARPLLSQPFSFSTSSSLSRRSMKPMLTSTTCKILCQRSMTAYTSSTR